MTLVTRRAVGSLLAALFSRENLVSLIALGGLILLSVLGGLSGSDDSSFAIYAYGAASLAACLLLAERLRQHRRLSAGRIEADISRNQIRRRPSR